MATQNCLKCGMANDSSAQFCGRCGAALATAVQAAAPDVPTAEPSAAAGTLATVACPRCGTANLPGARFCGGCGSVLGVAPGIAAGAAASGAAPSPAPPLTVACPRCGLGNAASARFCGRCGFAFGTASAYSVPGAVVPTQAFPRASRAQVLGGTPHKSARGIPWAALIAVLGISVAVLAVVSQQIVPHAAEKCGINCQPPPPPAPPAPLTPAGPPLPAAQTYTSTTYGYAVEYLPNLTPSASDAQSVSWSGQLSSNGDAFAISVQGEAANGRTPQQLVEALQQAKLSGATVVFNIGGAELGYNAGYGNVYDLTVSPQGGQQQHLRALVEAAVRGDVAVEVVAISGFTPDKNSHPSPAQLEPAIEQVVDNMGNTVTWKGDQPV